MNLKLNNKYQIKTPEGYCDFKGVKKSIIPYHFKIIFEDGDELRGSENHQVQLEVGEFWEISLLIPGDVLKNGKIVKDVECMEEPIEVFDIIQIDNDSSSYNGDKGLIHHNCAFIDNIDTIFASAQQTLATGGGCIALSTPCGTGNWFHKTWEKAEVGANSFVPIKLPWYLHPERDQNWRNQQDDDLGTHMAAQECDCCFATSGDTVFDAEIIKWYEENLMEPVEKRGVDGSLWIWELPDYTKQYAVIADVARGDGKDNSGCHVIDIETVTQVAEYSGQISTREFGNLLVNIATEYNDALLVIENANIGWDTVQTAIDREYKNLYYSPKTEALTSDQWERRNENADNMVAGFTTSVKTRPLIIEKFREYARGRLCNIRSRRLIAEMKVFIWKNRKAQAQDGYNDDLVMSFAIGLYIRDTALRFKKYNTEHDIAVMSNFSVDRGEMNIMAARGYNFANPWQMTTSQGNEDLTWLLPKK